MPEAYCPWPLTEVLVNICERDQCSWVVEPGNTGSNIAYFLVALWILWRSDRNALARWFGWVALAITVGSTLYHGTGQEWARYGDFFGVFLLTGVMTALNTRRWLSVGYLTALAIAVLLPLLLIAAVVFKPSAAVWIYVLAAPCCLIELRLLWLHGNDTQYRDYLLAWGMAAIATLAWVLDTQPGICQPDWHGLTGHTVWHILSAIALLLLWRFYSQFSGSMKNLREVD